MPKGARLSTTEVEHLAKLARLELTKAEVERYAKQLGDVLGYVSNLQELTPGTAQQTTGEGVALRPDAVSPWPETQRLVEQAPQHHDNLVEVPAVFSDRE